MCEADTPSAQRISSLPASAISLGLLLPSYVVLYAVGGDPLALARAACRVLGWLSLLAMGWDPERSEAPATESNGPLGAPCAKLSEADQARFQRGMAEFLEADTAAEALGPLFNGASCSHCHALGGLGGGGIMRVARAVCADADGAFGDPPGGS